VLVRRKKEETDCERRREKESSPTCKLGRKGEKNKKENRPMYRREKRN